MNIQIMEDEQVLLSVWWKPSIPVPRVDEKIVFDVMIEEDGIMQSKPTMGYVSEVVHNYLKDELKIYLRDVGEADDVI